VLESALNCALECEHLEDLIFDHAKALLGFEATEVQIVGLAAPTHDGGDQEIYYWRLVLPHR
jgi:hypothetical protein